MGAAALRAAIPWLPGLLLAEVAASPSPLVSIGGLDIHQEKRCKPLREPIVLGQQQIQLKVGSDERRFLLFTPKPYSGVGPLPLWILAPGTLDSPERFLDMSEVSNFAQEHNFAFAALEGKGRLLNVVRHGRAKPDQPDDVEYTKGVLREASKRLCIDRDRIRCVGFSRGARFCSRLASELSNFIASVGAVSGIRFPTPNNASRPMPIIAFHGKRDPVNPFWGNGNPEFWKQSIPAAVKAWSDFNGCKSQRWEFPDDRQVISHHAECHAGADVVLVILKDGGHTWPGSNFKFDKHFFGYTDHHVDSKAMMWQFFVDHPRNACCHTATTGDKCHQAVQQAMRTGLAEHPEWSERLAPESSLEEYQAILHEGFHADCPLPCNVVIDDFELPLGSSGAPRRGPGLTPAGRRLLLGLIAAALATAVPLPAA